MPSLESLTLQRNIRQYTMCPCALQFLCFPIAPQFRYLALFLVFYSAFSIHPKNPDQHISTRTNNFFDKTPVAPLAQHPAAPRAVFFLRIQSRCVTSLASVDFFFFGRCSSQWNISLVDLHLDANLADSLNLVDFMKILVSSYPIIRIHGTGIFTNICHYLL